MFTRKCIAMSRCELTTCRFGVLLYQMLTTSVLAIIFDENERIARIKSAIEDINFQEFIINCCKTDPILRPTIEECISFLQQMKKETTKDNIFSLLAKKIEFKPDITVDGQEVLAHSNNALSNYELSK